MAICMRNQAVRSHGTILASIFLSSNTDWSLYNPDILQEDTADWPAEDRGSCCAVCFRNGMEVDLTRWFFHLDLMLVSRSNLERTLFQNAIDSNQCNPRGGAVSALSTQPASKKDLTCSPMTDIENPIRNPIHSAVRRIAFRHFRPGNDGATNQYHPVNPACPVKLRSTVHKVNLFNRGLNNEGVSKIQLL